MADDCGVNLRHYLDQSGRRSKASFPFIGRVGHFVNGLSTTAILGWTDLELVRLVRPLRWGRGDPGLDLWDINPDLDGYQDRLAWAWARIYPR